MAQEQAPAVQQDAFVLRAGDGSTLQGERWTAAGRPKASLVLSHGYAEHIGRYGHVLRPLAINRFAIYAVDHRGHGKSAGARALVRRFDQYVDDLDLVVSRARQEHGGKPCYLFGHSMGGLIALRYALAHPEKIDALVLSAPAIRTVQTVSKLQEASLRLIAKVAPGMPVVPSLEGVLSSDPAVEERTKQDQFYYNGKTKAKQAVEIVDAGREVLKRASQLKMPLLILQGSDDELVAPQGSEELYKLTNSRPGVDTSMVVWPGMRHELLNEPDGDQVLGVIIAWLNGHYVEWRKAQPR
jgi:acylglycerol lipase